MYCLACEQHITLRSETTDAGLRLRRCPVCGGRWIRVDDYQRWVGGSSNQITAPDDRGPVPEDDSGRTGFRRCPEDGYFLIRVKLSSPHDFSIERCHHCSGMWFDRDEWESLQHAGLARELPVILPDDWDAQLRARQERRMSSGDDLGH